MTIEDLMQYGYVELRYIIEWARKVPGMCDEKALFTFLRPLLVRSPPFYDQKKCWAVNFYLWPEILENGVSKE